MTTSWVGLVLVALAACAAPARTPAARPPAPPAEPPSSAAAAATAAYCPPADVDLKPWMPELFPACPAAPLPHLVPCGGACPRPCAYDERAGGMLATASSSTIRFQYDDRGRWIATTSDGHTRECTWRGERVDACRTDNGTTRAVRDRDGRLTAVIDGTTTIEIRRDGDTVRAIGDVTFTYDALGRLRTADDLELQYDGRGRVSHTIDRRSIETYRYDDHDRMVEVVSVRKPPPPAAPHARRSYQPREYRTRLTYDGQGRLERISAGPTGGTENDGREESFQYDCR